MSIFKSSLAHPILRAFPAAKDLLEKVYEIRCAARSRQQAFDWQQADRELWELLASYRVALYGTIEQPIDIVQDLRKVRAPRGVARCGIPADCAYELVKVLGDSTSGATTQMAGVPAKRRKTFLSQNQKCRDDLAPLSRDELAQIQADLIEEAEIAFGGTRQPRIKLANDARDKWLYGQLSKVEVTQSTVMRRLASECQKRNWRNISDVNAAKQAADRWAERNGKPPIPKRQHGRKVSKAK